MKFFNGECLNFALDATLNTKGEIVITFVPPSNVGGQTFLLTRQIMQTLIKEGDKAMDKKEQILSPIKGVAYVEKAKVRSLESCRYIRGIKIHFYPSVCVGKSISLYSDLYFNKKEWKIFKRLILNLSWD